MKSTGFQCTRLRRVVALAILSASAIHAQATFGAITGVVSDNSGAIVPGVTITINNQGTNISKIASTDQLGNYTVTHLNPGLYTLTAQMAGFKKSIHKDVPLKALDTVRIDVRLEVGGVDTEVTVRSEVPAVETEASSVADVRTSQDLRDLPLNLRSTVGAGGDSALYSYVHLVPTGSQGSGSQFSMGGSRGSQNYFNVDGISSNSAAFGNAIGGAQPLVESMREVRFEFASNRAEFGEVANITTITKSGQNGLHGGLFWYHFNSALTARSFFAIEKGHDIRNDTGGFLGGPIRRNKAFFFVAYEAPRQRQPGTIAPNVPTVKMRQGDFSELLASTSPISIVNPYTGQPFSGNVIPPNLLSPAALKWQERFFPLPNFGPPASTVANFRGTYTQPVRHDQMDVRIDYQAWTNNSLYGRVSYKRTAPDTLGGALPPTVAGYDHRLLQPLQLALSDTWILTPRLINEFKFGFTQRTIWRQGDLHGQEIVEGLGITGLPQQPSDMRNIPQVNVTGFVTLVQTAQADNLDRTTQFVDQVTLLKGRHNMKAGAEYRPMHVSSTNFPTFGTYGFTNRFTRSAYADFLLGLPTTTTRQSTRPSPNTLLWFLNGFIQDDFKVLPRLTLSYGVRYEYNRPAVDALDIISNFDPRTGAIIVPTEKSLKYVNPAFPSSIPILTASQAGFPMRALRGGDRNNFLPRIGFAYRPFGDARAAVRGGYGIFNDDLTASIFNQLSGSAYQVTESFTNSISGGTPLVRFERPFLERGTLGSLDVQGISRELRNPYVQQWNVTVERQAGSSAGVRVSYIGAKSTGLDYRRNINQPPASTIPFSQNRRPYPLYRNIVIVENGGNQVYHALSTEVERRFSQGLYFQVAWTWAKSLTDVEGEGESGSIIENSYDRSRERGVNPFSPSHRLISNVIWEFPIGKGKRYFNRSGPVDLLLGGWQVSATYFAQTGLFLTPTFAGADPSNTQTIGGRPDRIADGNLPSGQRTIERWFDTAAFAVPRSGRFGTSGRGVIVGPGLSSLNAGIFKSFAVTEKSRVRFQLTATNALNHPNFDLPASNISAAGSVGRITAIQERSSGGPRQVLAAIRFEF